MLLLELVFPMPSGVPVPRGVNVGILCLVRVVGLCKLAGPWSWVRLCSTLCCWTDVSPARLGMLVGVPAVVACSRGLVSCGRRVLGATVCLLNGSLKVAASVTCGFASEGWKKG